MPPLRLIVLAIIATYGVSTHAVGLGPIRVQSGLGQPLRANIPLIGTDANAVSGTCVKATLSSADGAFIVAPRIGLSRGELGNHIILSSRLSIQEPAITIGIDVGCSTPIHRDYQVLLDPVELTSYPGRTRTSQDELVENKPGIIDIARPQMPPVTESRAPVREREEKKTRNNQQVAVGGENGQVRKNPRNKEQSRTEAREKPRDVLRLSGDEKDAVPSFQMTQSLSAEDVSLNQQTRNDIKVAQQSFAAMLRGESIAPPVVDSAEKIENEKKLNALRAEAAQMRRQNKIDKEAAQKRSKKSFSPAWVYTLGGLLLLSLGTLGWLAWRMRSIFKTTDLKWWEYMSTQSADGTASPSQDDAARREDFSEWNDSIEKPETSGGKFTKAGQPAEQDQQNRNAVWSSNLAAGLPRLESSTSQLMGNFPMRANALNVEEISDVTQEAEFWISLNDPHRAIEILEPHSDVEKPDSPVPWLYLLDLYSNVGDQEKYNALRGRFMHLFNAYIPDFDAASIVQNHDLADFPLLLKRICDNWKNPDILSFLEGLLVDDRDGSRTGFDLTVYRDILLLIGVLHERGRMMTVDFVADDPDQANPAANASPYASGRQNSAELAADSLKSSNEVDFNIEISRVPVAK